MATNEPPIEDPYRRSRRITPAKPTRRIGRPAESSKPPESPSPAIDPALTSEAVQTAPDQAAPVPTAPDQAAPPVTEAPVVEVSPVIPSSPPSTIPTPAEQQAAQPLLEIREPTGPSRYQRVTPPKLRSGKKLRSSSSSSVITILVLSALLLGYAFNIASIQAAADAALAKMNGSAQAHGSPIVNFLSRIAPWIILLPVIVLFYAIMKQLAVAIGLSRKEKIRTERAQRKRPLDEFKKVMADYGISSRMAYQAFLLLQPHAPEGETPDPNATLEGDLGMTAAQVREIHLNLLRATQREADPATWLPNVTTVLDLVAATHRAPKKIREPLAPVFEPGDPSVKNR